MSMMRLVSEQLPMYILFHNFSVISYSAGLQNLDARAPGELVLWNLHEWQLR
jgi:hypothetical protein